MNRFALVTIALMPIGCAAQIFAAAPSVSADIERFRANVVDFYTGKGADLKDPFVADALARMEQTAQDYLESMTVDGADPGPIEPPTPEEIARRRADDQAGTTKKADKITVPKVKDPSGKPSGEPKGDGKKSRGGEIGGWRDLLPSIQGTPNSAMWSIGLRAHYDRVLLLAQAYHTSGQSLHQRPDVKQAVERGLTFAAKYVYASMGRIGMNDPREVRVPMRLGPILILMRGDLDSDVFQRQVQLLAQILPVFEKVERASGGANLVWSMMNHQFHALLVGDAEKMNRAARLIGSSCVVGDADGIQSDNSYLFHDGIVTIGSYGTGQVHELARYALFAKGTAYTLTDEQLATIVDFAADGMLWSMYHNYPAASAVGRAVTRGQKQTGGFHSLLYLANTPNRRQDEFAAAAKKMLETWQDDDDTYRGQISAVNGATAFEIAGLTSAVKRSPVAAAWPTGHRHYPRADYTVHRGTGYFLSVKMLSKRVRSGERAWGDGMKTWHLSDGFTYLARRGNEYFENDVLPTLDWQRLPGTTVERKDVEPGDEAFGFGTRTFVGGTSVGRSGVAAMDFAANGSPLTAKKSWFFFDDEIVCLGSDIDCPTANRAETIVTQWPLVREDAALMVDGRDQLLQTEWNSELSNVIWAACDGIGYYFPGGQTLQARLAVQTGEWNEIGSRPEPGTRQNSFLTLWYDHGSHAAKGRYAYALLPNRTPEAVAQYAASEPFTILAQTDDLHAVRHKGLRATGAVFWRPGAVDIISVDSPCIVFYRQTDDSLTLAASDPTHGDDKIGSAQINKNGRPRQPTSAETTFRITVKVRLAAALNLPDGVTIDAVGNQSTITFRARDGRNFLAKFAIVDR